MSELFNYVGEIRFECPKHMQGYLLSENLYALFVNYIRSCRFRAPKAKQLTELIMTFQDGAKRDRRALQSKFKSWSRRMDVRETDGKLVIRQSGKEILPIEKCYSLVMELHCQTEEHRDIDCIVHEIRKTYSWGRRDFGMDWDVVSAILKTCNKIECQQKLQMRLQPKCVSSPPLKRMKILDIIQESNNFVQNQNFRSIMPILITSDNKINSEDAFVQVTGVKEETESKQLLTAVSSAVISSQLEINKSLTNNLQHEKRYSYKSNSKSNTVSKKLNKKISFKIEIDSSDSDLKCSDDFKNDLKNFITSYFKNQTKSNENNIKSDVLNTNKLLIQNYPVWQNILLSSNSKSPFRILTSKEQNISITPINSSSHRQQSLNSGYFINSSIQNISNNNTASILTYTLPDMPLSFTPKIQCLISSSNAEMNSDRNSNQKSLNQNHDNDDYSSCQITPVKIQSKTVSVPTEIDINTLNDDVLNKKSFKFKYVLEKPERKLENNLNIKSSKNNSQKHLKSKIIRYCKTKSVLKNNVESKKQMDNDKNVEDLYESLIESIHSIKGKSLHIGTSRGKDIEFTKGIDRCLIQIKELKKKL
ncbi:serine/threonine-protein kinase pakD-like [Centruroides sculpturatus]|uniref:serine/threonine-protein kinase pakD-like n=1 Tax=Centruroides sculpturatus TaxID=218467 RepID=UPI000C6D9B02|nr:serine/threonine-protein kinase pakD-like [Centruroides sculpturatus]